MEEYIDKLELCKYNNIASNSVVFKFSLINDYIWLHIPNNIQYEFEIFKFQEVTTKCIDIAFNWMVYRENNEPYYKVSTKILNLESGLHVYRIQFKQNSEDEQLVSLYFSYIIQDDNPAKPYKYMNKNNESDQDNQTRNVWFHM